MKFKIKKNQIELTSKPYDMGDGTYCADCLIEGKEAQIDLMAGFMGECTKFIDFVHFNCYDYENTVDIKIEDKYVENFEIINFDEFVPSIFGF